MRINKGLFFISIIAVLLSLPSCASFKKFQEDRAELNIKKEERKRARKAVKLNDKEESVEKVVETKSTEVIREEPSAVNRTDSLYLSYERTACFGRCPIYKIKIFDSGYAIYEGINFVERMGEYGTVIAEIDLATIEKKLADMYFFELKNRYDNELLTDLPSKVIEVRKPNLSKTIVARTDVPPKLIELFDHIDSVIDSVAWKPLN